jgi:hypothetical protein
LPDRRGDEDGNRNPGFVPDAVAVGGSDTEDILPAGQIGVAGIAPVPGLDPILIEAFEFVGISILLRSLKVEGGEFKEIKSC